MAKEWDVLNALRHYRHDWLNHMQLINGYIAMGRTEKVETLIDDIVNQAKNESHLSNLNMNQLAEEILTFNWNGHSFSLNFEVISESKDWSNWEELLLSFFREFMKILDLSTKYGEEQQAVLMMNDIESITVEIDFQGSLRINKEWIENIKRIERRYGNHIDQIEWNESECYVKFVADIEDEHITMT
ncbi:Spo0B domain-containing protein [Salipaludibacillus keqinensis]|nr:Spo0B C-terminal domain-containing protein [Salipaludibacillus keqinensis]